MSGGAGLGWWSGWVALMVLAAAAWFRPDWAPAATLGALGFAVRPLRAAWAGASGTALRPAVAWAAASVGLAAAGQVVGIGEAAPTGRPMADVFIYLSALSGFAALISVLNARTPGGGAWAMLMALLVLVFLLPWLEAPGVARADPGWGRLRLGAPWTIFFGLLMLAGLTNHLPTRFGPASAWLAAGFALVYLALTRTDWPVARRGVAWWAFPFALAAAARSARGRAFELPGGSGLERLWLWFRDRWGVVWALRVQERFNRSAESAGWPIRLGWGGVEPAGAEVPPAAEAVLAGLLRRFAGPGAVAAAVGRPCPGDDPLR